MSLELYLQPSAKVLRALHGVLLIAWGGTFVAVHWFASVLYLIPLLALITFFLLAPFPRVVAALFLSGYLDSFPTDPMLGIPRLLLIGGTWLAALVALGANAAYHRHRLTAPQPEPAKSVSADHEIPTRSESSISEAMSSVSSAGGRSSNFRHDIRTPLNLILGFCEALLTPGSADQQPLPAPFRAEVEAIYRNGQQLKPLMEKLLESPSLSQGDERAAGSPTTQRRKTVILLDEGGAAFELFSQYLPRYEVIRAVSLEALGRLRQDGGIVAVAISSDDYTLIPVVAQIVGHTVPILAFNLAEAQPPMQFHGASGYLRKPVEFEALIAALERTGALLRTVLIVDDNRDNMHMLSRMLNSIPEPPQILKAYSGREALAMLREETPDVILLDFVLPDLDGMAILNYVRMEHRLARSPVLLVSAHHLPDILPLPGVTKLTLFRLAGFSPVFLAQHIEAFFSAFGSPD